MEKILLNYGFIEQVETLNDLSKFKYYLLKSYNICISKLNGFYHIYNDIQPSSFSIICKLQDEKHLHLFMEFLKYGNE